jgi:hypothetical protein
MALTLLASGSPDWQQSRNGLEGMGEEADGCDPTGPDPPRGGKQRERYLKASISLRTSHPAWIWCCSRCGGVSAHHSDATISAISWSSGLAISPGRTQSFPFPFDPPTDSARHKRALRSSPSPRRCYWLMRTLVSPSTTMERPLGPQAVSFTPKVHPCQSHFSFVIFVKDLKDLKDKVEASRRRPLSRRRQATEVNFAGASKASDGPCRELVLSIHAKRSKLQPLNLKS